MVKYWTLFPLDKKHDKDILIISIQHCTFNNARQMNKRFSDLKGRNHSVNIHRWYDCVSITSLKYKTYLNPCKKWLENIILKRIPLA